MTEWRPVPSWPDYEASSDGQIRSLERRHRLTGGMIGGRVLRQQIRTDNGRPQVEVWRDGARRTIRVHTLVCEAFHGPQPDGQIVLHGDNVVTNNAADNLRWGTWSDNTQDCLNAGRHPQRAKTACPHGHAYDEANTRVTKEGHRQCRACQKIRNDARRVS